MCVLGSDTPSPHCAESLVSTVSGATSLCGCQEPRGSAVCSGWFMPLAGVSLAFPMAPPQPCLLYADCHSDAAPWALFMATEWG